MSTMPLVAVAPPLSPLIEPVPDGDPRSHVRAMLAEFETIMLVTHRDEASGTPRPHARPMRIARIDEDCTVWFVTDIDSPKIDEVLSPPVEGQVLAQDRTRFMALRGTFRVRRDPETQRALWTKEDEVWFPEGPEGERVCLLAFVPTEAELWDVSGARGLKFLLSAARALLTGEAMPPVHGEEHDKVDLRG